MSMYFHLRSVPAPALRNSANWLQRLFEDDRDAVRWRIDRRREEVLDRRYLDQELLYACAPSHAEENGAGNDVVLGGTPVFPGDRQGPPLLLLPAGRAARVAAFLTTTDFETLWRLARDHLLPRYDGTATETETRCALEAAHRDLRSFYAQTAEYGDAVVKRLMR
ncbi:DUF1877 family protein [Streptomyces sp. NPDC007264]|uniref:DUF1877 family protein n=1 Tax=Streptomyces sp. NPDC007264 TaxID=3364777 RepID=UPI0036DEA9A3